MNKQAKEELLLMVLSVLPGRNDKAIMLQSFIAENGPLSKEAGVKVRELLGAKPNEQENR
jgi:hypothetical protein